MKKILALLLCYPLLTLAQYSDENIWLEEDSANNEIDYRKIETKKETLLRDDSIIYGENSGTGVRDAKHYTAADKNQFNLSYHTTRRLRNSAQFRSFEFIYGHRFKHWWLMAMVNKMDTRFEEVSENKENTSIGNGAKPDDLNMTFLMGGLGLSYRFKLLNHWTIFENIYHTTSVFGTYLTMTEKLSEVNHALFGGLVSRKDLDYTGYGMRADYGIHYRAAQSFHYGLKMTYNLGWVEREALTSIESNTARRLNLAWMSLAAEIGYYF